MPAPSRTAKISAIAVIFSLAAGCAGGRTQSGVIAKGGGDTGTFAPRKLGLTFPQLAPDSMPDRNASGGTRPFNGAEINTVVHAALRSGLADAAKPEVRDLAAAGPGRERVALLTTVILREYWLNGTLPPRPVNELGRATQCDAVLIVSVIKFGPSTKQLVVKNLGGEVRPSEAGTGGTRWINCGIKVALVKISSALPVWEAAYLESRPDAGNSQEMVAAACVDKLLSEFPFKK